MVGITINTFELLGMVRHSQQESRHDFPFGNTSSKVSHRENMCLFDDGELTDLVAST